MNKYLEKAAFSTNQRVATGVAMGTGLGAIVGGLDGYSHKYGFRKGKTVVLTKDERKKNAIKEGVGIGLSWGLAGGMMGKTYNKGKAHYDYHRRYGAGGIGRGVGDLHRELHFPPGGFKTKAEAKTHFRRMSSKLHPDRAGGNADKMKNFNKAWQEFEAHPDGFNKLAQLCMTKIASLLA